MVDPFSMDAKESVDMDGITFRTITQTDREGLLALYRHLNPEDPPLMDKEAVRDTWNAMLADPKISCFVADHQTNLIASCVLVVIPNLTRGAQPYGLIENVVTHPDFRKQGIGTALLQFALSHAWTSGCYKVMLLTGRKEESVMQFYEKAGFKKGIKTGFIAYPT
jgi:GNAT superfamily N-acetyltransferase